MGRTINHDTTTREEDYGSALIELTLSSKVTSIRLLSYYRTAISKHIEPSRAAISVEEHLDPLLNSSSTTTTKEESANLSTSSDLLRSIANELLAKPVTSNSIIELS
ncbi:hypothetical protein KEM48_007045 [Puccinia striiformis f. sp. tritici PST-130]|nr:hypothetical protein KEM48_007045 [Puccinia striiformis f. sp. tritici PST-130]